MALYKFIRTIQHIYSCLGKEYQIENNHNTFSRSWISYTHILYVILSFLLELVFFQDSIFSYYLEGEYFGSQNSGNFYHRACELQNSRNTISCILSSCRCSIFHHCVFRCLSFQKIQIKINLIKKHCVVN